ncbi:MAG: hypothetical protein IPJ19_12550 [Planctomycetes bacterium]|nr:hypothetical protein [Planctomycetota bacterium]
MDKHSMPDCQPLAMRYFAPQAGHLDDSLFIAGGALGLWRMPLCSSLFLGSNPTGCAQYLDDLVEPPIALPAPKQFERKRCVDVEILKDHQPPVLFALFGSRSDHATAGEVTELRAYDLSTPVPLLMATCYFSVTTGATPYEVGTALTADPGDSDSIYVAMGEGGIQRVDLSGSAGSWSLAETKIWPAAGCAGGLPNEHVRDLAIVRVAFGAQTKAMLYGALNHGEILEITDLTGAPSCAVLPLGASTATAVVGYPEKIAAICTGQRVCVAVAPDVMASKADDSFAPSTPNGFWNTICFTQPVLDPYAPDLVSGSPALLWIYDHDFSASGNSLALRTTLSYPKDPLWNTLEFWPQVPGISNRLYVNSELNATEAYDVPVGSGAVTPAWPRYAGAAFHAQDSLVSSLNSGVVLFQSEYLSRESVLAPPKLVYIDPLNYAITPVADTANSPCANPTPYLPNCPDSTAQGAGPQDPALYSASLLDEAHWIDPTDPQYEYFLPGRQLLDRHNQNVAGPPPCPIILDCDPGFTSWCNGANVPSWNLQKRAQAEIGWRLIKLRIPAPPLAPPNGQYMEAKSWQFQDPVTGAMPGMPAEQYAMSDDRTQSLVDPRMTASGYPTAVYLTRAGTSHGVTAFRPEDIVANAVASCDPIRRGTGERLTGIDNRSILTHRELEANTASGQPPNNFSCKPIIQCNGEYLGASHHLYQGRTDLYTTRDDTGAKMWILAIATGSVASDNDPSQPQGASTRQLTSCRWGAYANAALLSLVDVTAVGDGSFVQPALLRVAIGAPSSPPLNPPPGNAFSVKVKTVGSRAWAYVGDLTGQLYVFDVSGRQLLPAVKNSIPYLNATFGGIDQPILFPVATIAMPSDPYDGQAEGCIDMEVDGDYLYCALGRQGIAVFGISNPETPVLLEVMDTPGLVLGLSTRTVGGGASKHTQLIVGDTMCGVRIYE